MDPPRSFKISENVTYNCIDIYKQPGLDHPMLKNHTVQMKPSISKPELKNQTGDNKTYKTKIRCPDGTVPILKNSKKYAINAQLFAETYSHSLLAAIPGTHIAGVRSRNGPYHGVQASFSIHKLYIERDQASFSHIYVGSRLKRQAYFIQAGWMINPSLFGDGRVWSYGYWKGKNGKGCYNTVCPGFVQVSQEVPIVEPIENPGEGWLHCSIHQDNQTGNWWVTRSIPNAPTVDIGYWPKELFNLMDNGANMVGAEGVVHASRSGSSPPMGNGNFPTKGHAESAIFTNIETLNSNYEKHRIDSFPIEQLVDSPECYGVIIGKAKRIQRIELGFFFYYGGLGGNSCGV